MEIYINAEELMCAIDGSECLDTERDYEEIAKRINECETADVQKVTRCKDCWAYETAEYDNGIKKVCRLFKRQMYEDDFCSYGEPPNCFEKHTIAKMDEKKSEND